MACAKNLERTRQTDWIAPGCEFDETKGGCYSDGHFLLGRSLIRVEVGDFLFDLLYYQDISLPTVDLDF